MFLWKPSRTISVKRLSNRRQHLSQRTATRSCRRSCLDGGMHWSPSTATVSFLPCTLHFLWAAIHLQALSEEKLDIIFVITITNIVKLCVDFTYLCRSECSPVRQRKTSSTEYYCKQSNRLLCFTSYNCIMDSLEVACV